MQVVLE